MKIEVCECGTKGVVILSDEDNPYESSWEPEGEDKTKDWPDGAKALFKYGNVALCFTCLNKLTSTCIGCLERTDTLYADKKCKNSPYVCKKCLDSTTTHTWDCESDGCLTPEEVAQDAYEFLLMECEDGNF